MVAGSALKCFSGTFSAVSLAFLGHVSMCVPVLLSETLDVVPEKHHGLFCHAGSVDTLGQ